MADKQRSISTKIWSDTWFENLSVPDKLLFLYLITNEKNNMLGIYEISLKKISFETGMDLEPIRKGLEGFERVNKIKYFKNHIILLNFLKHQKFNENMKKSAIDCYNELCNDLKFNDIEFIKERDSKGFRTLCKGFGTVRKIEREIEREIENENENENEKEIFLEKKEEFLNSDMWIESISIQFKQKPFKIKTKLNEFLNELYLKGDWYKDNQEIKKHFINWVKIQINKENA